MKFTRVKGTRESYREEARETDKALKIPKILPTIQSTYHGTGTGEPQTEQRLQKLFSARRGNSSRSGENSLNTSVLQMELKNGHIRVGLLQACINKAQQ